MSRLRRTALVLLALLLLAACSNRSSSINRRPQSGGSASASASDVNGVQQVRIEVGDTYRFSPDVITVHPGPVQVTLVHTGTGAPHDFSVVGFPADFVPLVNPKGTSTATFTAPAPGTYKFICTIHEKQGQIGQLIVTSG